MSDRITESIWIGNSQDASSKIGLLTAGIKAILNCAVDLDDNLRWSDGFRVFRCGLVDGPGNNLSAYQSAMMQLSNIIESGCKVLVHCHEGRSRSVAVVAMYLEYSNLGNEHGWDYWIEMIAEKRSAIDPKQAHKIAFLEMFKGDGNV